MDNFFFRRREVIEIGYETLVNFDRDMAAPPNIVQGNRLVHEAGPDFNKKNLL